MKKWLIGILLCLFVLSSHTPIVALAEEPADGQENPECLPEESFSRYQYVVPSLLMPDVESIEAEAVWNYQCPHSSSVEVLNDQGQLVVAISGGSSFGNGENTVQWNGLDNNGNPVPDGVYTIRITPLDEFRDYAIEVNVTIKLFKYPAIYGVFGDELKEQVKNLP